ncbi:hypothetical protein SLS63_011387 [Diaporthe eres]|uniref:Uncharacterized protein n=1 Tax=Diaporthe eres TaxID=83184 RepID=A0ABR1NU81_DIAER
MSTATIEASADTIARHGVADYPNEAEQGEQNEKPFPFLRLPAEIRNTIYHELLTWHWWEHEDNRLYEQPAITRVSSQLRAEALPLYFGEVVHLVKTESSRDWVPSIQRIVDNFTRGPGGQPGSSSLRLLNGIQLDFMTPSGVHIEVDLVTDPENLTVRAPGDPSERVIVGSPDLDWTDAAAVGAACDEAALLLEEDLRGGPLFAEEGVLLVQPSDIPDQRAALDALRIFALACPHLTSVCICDSSHAHRVDASVLEFMDYVSIRERLLASGEE